MVLQTSQWTASKRINWCSQCMAAFYWRNVTLTNLLNNLSFIHNPTKLWNIYCRIYKCLTVGSALVLSFDFWRTKQWPTTIKAASPLTENVASSVYSLSNLLEFQMIYFTADSVSTNKNWLIYDASHCLMFNPCEQKSRCFAWSATADLSSCEQNF